MIEKLIEARQVINQLQITDIQGFILKNQKKYDADFLRLIAEQYISRQKAKHKIPTWYANENILFPAPLSVEQASSEVTATYKAQVFAQNFGTEKCADLTGGMGLDSWALSEVTQAVTYIEQNQALALVAEHNFEVLGQKNIRILNQNSVAFIQSLTESTSNFYIDPHRRDNSNNKVFRIEDCEPNILTIKHLLKNYLVKFSPMLDIKLGIEQLQTVSEVHIVALENEVKEVLFVSNSVAQQTPKIYCINFTATQKIQRFVFDYETESTASVSYANPLGYIYEPNAAILKAGAFKSIAQNYGLMKLAPNSHLYTSAAPIENFAGRSFICEAVCRFDKKEILAKLPTSKANISTRNFPMKPEEIKKKLGLHDGGEYYLFATENQDKQKIVLVCKKAEQA